MLWKDSSFVVSPLCQNNQVIHFSLATSKFDGIVSVVYGSSNFTNRHALWDSLRNIGRCVNNQPWILMGDFNAMLRAENKRGGGPILRRATADFASCVQDCGLIEIESRGPSLTWKGRGVAEKLDWVFGNDVWKRNFPSSFVDHLARTRSDHCPFLIHGVMEKRTFCKPFRFQSAWILDYRFDNVVQNSWGTDPCLVEALSNLISVLNDWNVRNFGNIFAKKKKMMNRLAVLQKTQELRPSNHLRNLEWSLQTELELTLLQEEAFWKQKL